MGRSLTSRTTITINPPAPLGASNWLGGNGAAYRGNKTFASLSNVVASIPNSGGWASLAGTRLSAVLITNNELAAISPLPAIQGTEGPAAIVRVWGSAAWNGYGWFIGGAGAHLSYYGNDLYLVRIADPVAVIRMHNPAPIAAVTSRGFGAFPPGVLVPPSEWPAMKVTDGFGFPAWGPTATHQYDGMVWDSATERLIVGGDAQSNVTNTASVGSPAEIEHNVWFMDPYASTPQGAWTKTSYATGPATFGADNGGVYAMVDNPDGTYSFRTRGGVRSVNPATKRVTSAAVGPGPIRDNYLFWRSCFRDASTNRYYELHVPNIGAPNATKTAAIYECTRVGYSKVAGLPSNYVEDSEYLDGNGGTLARNGAAYIWNATSTVWRVDLVSGQTQIYSDGTSIPSPGSNNGVWGRWAFVPECGCFVGISSHTGDVQVFRPPSSWQVA